MLKKNELLRSLKIDSVEPIKLSLTNNLPEWLNGTLLR